MKYGLSIINFGAYGDPRLLQRAAATAEEAGWDGLFLWDHLAFTWGEHGGLTGDPWTLLAACACVTERLILGTNVTPVPRRRPQVLATQVATVDRLSHGRAVLGVGLGAVAGEFEQFGESFDARARATSLDAGLVTIVDIWSAHGATVQQPRVPIWVGGETMPARRRAARWDGWTTGILADETGRVGVSAETFGEKVQSVLAHRETDGAFDIVVDGYSPDAAFVIAYKRAGATWWLEGINGLRGSVDDMAALIAAGPPR